MKDLKTEQFMDQGQWAWEHTGKVLLSRVNMPLSRDNPGRRYRRIEDERVIRYGIAMEAGSEFPAPVFLIIDNAPKGQPDLLVATGMHRLAAMELAGKTETDAYIVNEPDEYRRDLLINMLNNIEGKAPSQAEDIQAILALHEKYPHITIAQLAKQWHIKPSAIKQAASLRKAYKRASDMGLDLEKLKLRLDSIRALGGIYDDSVFVKVCRFVIDHQPSGDDIDELCREIREAPHEQRVSLEIVAKYKQAAEFKQAQQRARYARTPQAIPDKFHSKLKQIARQGDQGLDRLHLAAIANLADFRIVIESVKTFMTRLLVETDRIASTRSKQQQKAAAPPPGARPHV